MTAHACACGARCDGKSGDRPRLTWSGTSHGRGGNRRGLGRCDSGRCPRARGSSPRSTGARRALEDTPGAGEQIPRHHQIDRRIAEAKTSPVDHGGETVAVDQQVGRHQVAVHPDGSAGPVRCPERLLPSGCGRVGVNSPFQRDECGAPRLIESRQRRRAPTRGRSAVDVDPVERLDELRKLSREPLGAPIRTRRSRSLSPRPSFFR